MKKLPLILAGATLVASVGAFADVLRNNALPFAVNVPNIRSGFEFNVEGLFLKSSNSDLDYGFITGNDDNGNAQTNLVTVKPDTDFGWGIGVGYVFPDSGNDVQLSWMGFDHTHRSSSSYLESSYSGPGPFLNTPYGLNINLADPDGDFDVPSDSQDVTTASGQAKFKLSVVDLDVGQYVDVGDRLQLHPFAGLRFARVENNLRGQYGSVDPIDPDVIYTEDDAFNSRFSGIGPLLGADANYNLGGGVHVAAHVATTLLVGKVDTDSRFASTQSNEARVITSVQSPLFAQLSEQITDSASIESADVTRVVPSLDAKLGLNYSYQFDCDSVVTVEGGYKVTQYIDAVDRLDTSSGQQATPQSFIGGSGSSAIATRNTSNVGFSGPYVKLAVKL